MQYNSLADSSTEEYVYIEITDSDNKLYQQAVNAGMKEVISNKSSELSSQLSILADEYMEFLCNLKLESTAEILDENKISRLYNMLTGSLKEFSADYIKRHKGAENIVMADVTKEFTKFAEVKINNYAKEMIESKERIENIKDLEVHNFENMHQVFTEATKNGYITQNETKNMRNAVAEYFLALAVNGKNDNKFFNAFIKAHAIMETTDVEKAENYYKTAAQIYNQLGKIYSTGSAKLNEITKIKNLALVAANKASATQEDKEAAAKALEDYKKAKIIVDEIKFNLQSANVILKYAKSNLDTIKAYASQNNNSNNNVNNNQPPQNNDDTTAPPNDDNVQTNPPAEQPPVDKPSVDNSKILKEKYDSINTKYQEINSCLSNINNTVSALNSAKYKEDATSSYNTAKSNYEKNKRCIMIQTNFLPA